jgi:hypothetical protein
VQLASTRNSEFEQDRTVSFAQSGLTRGYGAERTQALTARMPVEFTLGDKSFVEMGLTRDAD